MAMTSVVPERSAPIIITGRSLSVIGMSSPALQARLQFLAEPFQESNVLFSRRVPEARAGAYVPEDGTAGVARIERQHRGPQPGNFLRRQGGRSDERQVDL